MRKRLAGTAALLVCLSTALAGEEDHPYKNAKVGDYAIYASEGLFDRTVTKTLVSKENGYLTFRVTDSAEKDCRYYPEFINLSKPYPGEDGFEKVAEGSEKVRIAGKVYDARWISLKRGRLGNEPPQDLKVWYCRELSLPLLKSERTIADLRLTIRLELVEFGHWPNTVEKPD